MEFSVPPMKPDTRSFEDNGAGADHPLRPTSYSVRFNVESGSETEDEKTQYSTRLDMDETVPLALTVSSDSESEHSGELSAAEDAEAQVDDKSRANSPDPVFDGEVTVYYDTVTMNPEWDNLDELEDEDSAEPATDTLSPGLLKISAEDPAQPTGLTDHSEAALPDTVVPLSSDASHLPPSTPLVAELDILEHSITDSIVEECGNITSDYSDSPVDYDADTSAWVPADQARDYSDTELESESDDDTGSSDDDSTFDMDIAPCDAAHVDTPASASTGQRDAPMAPAPVARPTGNAASLCAAGGVLEVQDLGADDANGQSGLPSAPEDFPGAFKEDSDSAPAPESAHEERKGPHIALSRAISVHSHSKDIMDTMDSTTPDTVAALTDAPVGSGTAGEIRPSDLKTETVVETVEPMSLPALLALHIQSALYANLVSLFLGGIYHTFAYIERIVPAGVLSVAFVFIVIGGLFVFVAVIVIDVLRSIIVAPIVGLGLTGFTGVVSALAVLLGWFHVCATGGDKRSAGPACSMIHGTKSATTLPELN